MAIPSAEPTHSMKSVLPGVLHQKDGIATWLMKSMTGVKGQNDILFLLLFLLRITNKNDAAYHPAVSHVYE
jgi:hypothetical protein